MKISKRALVIFGISIILVILIIIFIVLRAKNNQNQINNTESKSSSEMKRYSLDIAMQTNSFENLLSDTGYFSFKIHPVKDVVKRLDCFAHEDYLIFKPIKEDFVIVTDKSNYYKIENGKIVKHANLYNYDMYSFIIDKSLHDIAILCDNNNVVITDRYMSSATHCKEKMKYLNENFSDIFDFGDLEYDGLNITYFFNMDDLKIEGYNLLGFTPTNTNNDILYVMNEVEKEVSDENKKFINEQIQIVKNSKGE